MVPRSGHFGMTQDSHPVADMVIRLYPQLLARLRRRMSADPEDLVQDLYLRLRRLPRDEEVRQPGPYLLRAADHAAIDNHRREMRQRTEELAEPEDPAPDVERQIDARRRLAVLRAAVEGLPRRQRDAFVLAKYQGMTQDRIAAHMGISRSAVEKLLVKAMATCRAAVEEAP
ncbi:sigma-70 family RNA polymerase sigma factor [Cereibacter sp. SYSU M97828]|nr:sigma-70 family RNA polymerase sigma factor [Cereibacter flavus]